MPINWAKIAKAGGIPKGIPEILTKGYKKRRHEEREAVWKAGIDARDVGVSRISGRMTYTGTSNPKALRDHCHIKAKGAWPALRYKVSNGFTATRFEHKCFHAGLLELEGLDANKRLIFRWNRDLVPVGDEPFRILSKRRSQQ